MRRSESKDLRLFLRGLLIHQTRIPPAPAPSRAECQIASSPPSGYFPPARESLRRRASPRLMSASVCFDEMPAAPSAYPLPKPACSISHAAGIFTSPPSAGKMRSATPAALCRTRSATVPAQPTGFLKKLPALRQSGSPSTSNMPFALADFAHRLGNLGERRRLLPASKMRLKIAVGQRRLAAPPQTVIHARHYVPAAIHGVEPALAIGRIRTRRS